MTTDFFDTPILSIELKSSDNIQQERVVQLNDAVVIFKTTPKDKGEDNDGPSTTTHSNRS